ncbi:proteasome maturation factor UMP1-domain-containing protein [Microdochium trichocladiopsis]|uniref:Proteasome maturation factor UMP1-domain-containing protein n=1 Tax=Microdochium trichocladiopsis TaxID=1682393 RepID=A0A9P8Y9G4_9PEZI|nr:proteasome maturation factor UMP1-domain-containing protein [Microdochium trichocladiopsis]KAH7035479.1 proteasome maturation factor UMP1-domain-containing protein [Microdochium trichocladiopsis]
MSMRIVPAADHTSTFTHLPNGVNTSAPSAPGLHDTLRHGLGPDPQSTTGVSDPPVSRHPLESRLKAWEATQESVRMESLRKTFGMAEPIRRGMELKITRDGEWRPLALGGSRGAGPTGANVHEDILRGREAFVDWNDVFTGEEQRASVGVHEEMERKLKI